MRCTIGRPPPTSWTTAQPPGASAESAIAMQGGAQGLSVAMGRELTDAEKEMKREPFSFKSILAPSWMRINVIHANS
jgi:hypothetical protein